MSPAPSRGETRCWRASCTFPACRQVSWSGPGQAPGVPGLVEPLTARELGVLHLLAAGAPNRRIADDLVVTLDTVKKHVTYVLGKLGLIS